MSDFIGVDTRIINTDISSLSIKVRWNPTSSSADLVCGGIVYTGVDPITPVAEATGQTGSADFDSRTLTLAATQPKNAIIGISVDDNVQPDTYSGTGTWTRQWNEENGGSDKISGSSAEQVFTDSGAKIQTVTFNNNSPNFAHSWKEILIGV